MRTLAALIAIAGFAAAMALAAPQDSTRQLMEERFDRIDLNKDGAISQDEFPLPQLFKAVDENHDAKISKAEALKYFAVNPKPEDARGGVEEIFFRADKDGDGKVTAKELPQQRLFRQLDVDGDGAITLEETRARLGPWLAALEAGRNPASAPDKSSPPLESTAQGPDILKGTDVGVGRQVADFSFRDAAGKDMKLSDIAAGKRGVCVALSSGTCPVSKRYMPALARLSREMREGNAALIVVNPMASESLEEFSAAIAGQSIDAVIVRDADRGIAAALGAATTTEVFLMDATRTLLYRGAIDDQYGISYNLESPRHEFLRDALGALAEGRLPDIAATSAPGCELEHSVTDRGAATNTGITFHRDIARILQQNCAECHHDGGIAPFALQTADDVIDRAKTIHRVIDKGQMPPWFAAPPPSGKTSPWINDCSLSARDKADLLAWLDGERPLGDPKDAPLPRQYPDGWRIGKPDAVLQMPKPIQIKAEGVMPYQYSAIETRFDEDKWVQAIEIRPSDKEVVHHIIITVEAPGQNVRDRVRGAVRSHTIATEAEEDESQGYFGAYVPGNSMRAYPDGYARFLPKGSKLRLQLHYTPKGTATEDQTEIALVFSDKPPQYLVKVAGIANHRLSIPPHAANHPQSAALPVPADVKVLAFMPHMHVRGKAFRYDVVLPGGERHTLLEVPRYDFNWQLAYRLAEPLAIPAGSRIEVTGWFDNSSANPANPDPNKTVTWGQQTFDEMLLGYVEYFVPVGRDHPPTAMSR